MMTTWFDIAEKSDDEIKKYRHALTQKTERLPSKYFINKQNKNGESPLHVAVQKQFLQAVIFILENGASINVLDNNSHTPLSLAALQEKTGAFNAIIHRTQFEPDKYIGYAILDAARTDKWEQVEQLIAIANQNNLDGKTYLDEFQHFKNNQTILHYAVTAGKTDIVKLLLENGANINARDDNNDTPLSLATRQETADVFNAIIGYKQFEPDKYIGSAILDAARTDKWEQVEQLIAIANQHNLDGKAYLDKFSGTNTSKQIISNNNIGYNNNNNNIGYNNNNNNSMNNQNLNHNNQSLGYSMGQIHKGNLPPQEPTNDIANRLLEYSQCIPIPSAPPPSILDNMSLITYGSSSGSSTINPNSSQSSTSGKSISDQLAELRTKVKQKSPAKAEALSDLISFLNTYNKSIPNENILIITYLRQNKGFLFVLNTNSSSNNSKNLTSTAECFLKILFGQLHHDEGHDEGHDEDLESKLKKLVSGVYTDLENDSENRNYYFSQLLLGLSTETMLPPKGFNNYFQISKLDVPSNYSIDKKIDSLLSKLQMKITDQNANNPSSDLSTTKDESLFGKTNSIIYILEENHDSLQKEYLSASKRAFNFFSSSSCSLNEDFLKLFQYITLNLFEKDAKTACINFLSNQDSSNRVIDSGFGSNATTSNDNNNQQNK